MEYGHNVSNYNFLMWFDFCSTIIYILRNVRVRVITDVISTLEKADDLTPSSMKKILFSDALCLKTVSQTANFFMIFKVIFKQDFLNLQKYDLKRYIYFVSIIILFKL